MSGLGGRMLGLSALLIMGIAANAQAAVTDLAAGATDLSQIAGESCILVNLGGSFCSVQGDCGKNSHIDSGASAVGKTVGSGPMVNASGFNRFNRYFGIVNGAKKLWIQVGAVGASNCKVAAGA